jgi:predicted transposase YbfD/YdcC
MTAQVPPLAEILAEVPDPRQSSGKRYPLGAMLTLACLAVLCGYRSIRAIAEWGPNYGEDYQEQLGFNEHGYPAQATWYRVLRAVDVGVVEARVRQWAEAVMQAFGGKQEGVSIDGKTLRMSRKMGASHSHLLSALAQGLGVVLGQLAVADHTNEIGVIEDFLLGLVLEGRVITADALLAQKEVAETIVEHGGQYVLPIKDNQPTTREAIEFWFAGPAPYEHPNRVAQTVQKGHGRIARRRLETTTMLNDYLDWPGLAQAFKLTRTTIDLGTGEANTVIAYGITSLPPKQASPLALLTFVQQHWAIENKLHWVRDVTFDEDRSQLRVGTSHHLMALLRNLAISLLRISGWVSIASALRFFAAQPHKALALLTQSIGE